MSLLISPVTHAIPAPSAADHQRVSAPALPALAGTGAPDAASLKQAVAALNQHYGAAGTDLHFTVDDASGQLVVAVVDAKDGTVLRQIPSEEALHIAQALKAGAALITRSA